MNELDPALKRLLKRARKPAGYRSEETPYGFSTRVLHSLKPAKGPLLLQEFQRAAWGLSWVAVALILCGALLLLSQNSPTPGTPQLSSALSFLASNFPR